MTNLSYEDLKELKKILSQVYDNYIPEFVRKKELATKIEAMIYEYETTPDQSANEKDFYDMDTVTKIALILGIITAGLNELCNKSFSCSSPLYPQLLQLSRRAQDMVNKILYERP